MRVLVTNDDRIGAWGPAASARGAHARDRGTMYEAAGHGIGARGSAAPPPGAHVHGWEVGA
jgi:hypothetical protein